MASILNTGIGALSAFKRQMETTGHNIANVNTEGYSRQTVQLGTREPEALPQGFIGSGVGVTSITRNYDTYLANRVRDYTSSHEEFSVYHQRASQIDNVIADASAGIDGMLQQFFDSVNDVADDPTSIPARSVMINRATQLSDRFNALDGWFEDIRHRVDQDFEYQANEINSIAQSLADVNARIVSLGGANGAPGDILDQRDQLIDELSQYTSVSTLEQGDGTMNVFVGTGQALVVGTTANQLAVTDNPLAVDQKELVLRQAGGMVVNVTDQMTGGSLGGLVRFRNEVLDEAQNALGRVAIGMASFFNAEHRTGMDLDGDLGGDFFSLAAPDVLGSQGNSGTISVDFDDVSDLTTHEYQLSYTGGAWSMIDLDTGSSIGLVGAGTAADPLVGDPVAIGIGIVTDGLEANGDTYRLRPTRAGASGFDVLVTDGRDIAAAEAVRSSANAANTGTGAIGPGALTTRSGNSKLSAPGITLGYQVGNQLALTSAPPGTRFVDANGNAIGANVAFVPGQTYRVEIPNLGIFDFNMTGAPAVGDAFSLSDNTGGVGDNRNARRLADLQTANLMIGGTASIADTYGALIADVGTRTHQAGSNANVQEHLLAQAESAKSEVSGVNLDEEAADLVRFQQAYQAAAQVINVANSLFDSLLNAVRR
ncbi:MAG: flagellar hook-associated protein FlgK [Sedimenticolaceae bacterium]